MLATIDSRVRSTPERELGLPLLQIRLGCRRKGTSAELMISAYSPCQKPAQQGPPGETQGPTWDGRP